MTNTRTILITGVTGNQGGAVARALQGSGFHLRGLTRKPDSERAAALAGQGIDIVKGDLDDEATLRRALAGAWGVFGVQNTGEAGIEREEAQGKRLATLAREAGATNDDISMRILELQTEQGNRIAAGTVKRLVGERNHRLEEWQIRWDEIRDALDTILIERGEELGNCLREGGATIAGGSTGFIV